MARRTIRPFAGAAASAALLAGAAAVLGAGHAHQTTRPVEARGVARIWHGRTPAAKADAYATYILDSDLRQMRALPGNLGIQVLRRDEGAFTDFLVISYWPSRDAVKQWAGANIELARYNDKDRELLVDLEPTVRHYDVVFDEGRASR